MNNTRLLEAPNFVRAYGINIVVLDENEQQLLYSSSQGLWELASNKNWSKNNIVKKGYFKRTTFEELPVGAIYVFGRQLFMRNKEWYCIKINNETYYELSGIENNYAKEIFIDKNEKLWQVVPQSEADVCENEAD